MAGAGVRVFQAGEVLTATLVNTYLQDQVVARFASASARDAAFGGSGEPTLEEGRVCYLDDTNVLQYYSGSAWVPINSEAVISQIQAKGDLVVGTGSSTLSRVAIGANDTILFADSSTATGVAWKTLTIGATSITNDMLVGSIADTKLATIATAGKVSNSATTADSANTASAIVARDAAGKVALTAIDVTTVIETANIVASPATGTINIDFSTSPTVYYTANATNDWTLNIRGTSGVTLNDTLTTGQIATVTFLATIGATQKRPTVFQVDGSVVTPKWMGGTAPTTGNASSIDAYTLVIIKTGSAAFTVLASQTKFA